MKNLTATVGTLALLASALAVGSTALGQQDDLAGVYSTGCIRKPNSARSRTKAKKIVIVLAPIEALESGTPLPPAYSIDSYHYSYRDTDCRSLSRVSLFYEEARADAPVSSPDRIVPYFISEESTHCFSNERDAEVITNGMDTSMQASALSELARTDLLPYCIGSSESLVEQNPADYPIGISAGLDAIYWGATDGHGTCALPPLKFKNGEPTTPIQYAADHPEHCRYLRKQ